MLKKDGSGRAMVSLLKDVTGNPTLTLNRSMPYRWRLAGPFRKIGSKANITC